MSKGPLISAFISDASLRPPYSDADWPTASTLLLYFRSVLQKMMVNQDLPKPFLWQVLHLRMVVVIVHASISKKNEVQTSESDKDGKSSSISGSIVNGSQQDYNVKEPVMETSRGAESNVPNQQKPSLKKPAARAKVPFEKGYSQMDWLKLTRTHPDLAGLNGQSNRRLITLEEVKQHKTGDRIWTVLKGHVYYIVPYMKFYPGDSHWNTILFMQVGVVPKPMAIRHICCLSTQTGTLFFSCKLVWYQNLWRTQHIICWSYDHYHPFFRFSSCFSCRLTCLQISVHFSNNFDC